MAFSLSSSHPLHAGQGLAADVQSLQNLKRDATQNDPAATKEAARQFESLFMREMIKSMREATMKSGLLDGAHGDLGTDMLDQQLSVQMSGQPGGLSEIIARQLAQAMGVEPAAASHATTPSTLSLGGALKNNAPTSGPITTTTTPAPAGRDAFVQHLSGTAERVAQESGIPAAFMLGQAGHETGWGKSAIKKADGSDSFNLFGIKATKGWTGKVAEVTTTEYIDGKPRKVTAKFRAYDSYEESFRDYARLIKESPRYEKAESVAKTGSAVAYAAALQKAGYATDPEYARKLSGAIQSALRAMA
ncbi:flagellar assembly peptidoglycan hydrolase FlgJ [Simplicispira sedimenti]|uniref:flagellar assembly peptidoglycan hydrolase FlgJ n=1 Tax=Simplicispira sedimenti TaxID=2919500 RepID=UPI001FAA3C4A|nr:flagellar assembly peptidoglycan hydrolase FlgJ [Acidovorax sp. W1-6]